MPNNTAYAQKLIALGYSPAAASGIVGNLQQESSLNPNITGDNGTSYGLAQWHNDRWDGLKTHAGAMGLDPSDPNAQLSYLDWELKNKEPQAYAGLQAAKTPEQAASAFLGFERPAGWSADNPSAGAGFANRVNNARATYAQLNGMPDAGAPSPQGLLATPTPPPAAAPQPQDNSQAPAKPAQGLLSFGQQQDPFADFPAAQTPRGLLRRPVTPMVMRKR